MLAGIVLVASLATAGAPDSVPPPREVRRLSAQVARGHGTLKVFSSLGRFELRRVTVTDSGVAGVAVEDSSRDTLRVPWPRIYSLETRLSLPNPLGLVGAVALGGTALVGGYWCMIRFGPEFVVPMVYGAGKGLELGSKLGRPRLATWRQIYPEF